MWKDRPHFDSPQEHHAQTTELTEAHSDYAEVQQLGLMLIIHLLLVLTLICGALPPLLCLWSFLIKYNDNLPALWTNMGACGGVVVKALRYKPAGRGSIPDGVIGIFQ